jgi:hypothetical protein
MRRAICLLLVASACDGSPEPSPPASLVPRRTTARADLRWKRARVVERDLSRALALTEADLCLELGRRRCLRSENAQRADTWGEPDLVNANAFVDLVSPGGVHLVPLGGNDPYFRNQHQPVSQPILTTPIALDRVVLAACSKRVTRDATPGAAARVFMGLDLNAALTPDAPAVAAIATTLYRRVLARDPSTPELEAVRASVTPPTTGRDLALMVCYATATSTEFLFQ